MKTFFLTLLVFCAIINTSLASCICEDATIGYTKTELQAEKESLAITLNNIKAMNLASEQAIQSKIVAVEAQVQAILVKEAEELPVK